MFYFNLDFFFSNFITFYFYFFILCLIGNLMLTVSKKVSFLYLPDKEKISEYECGFEPLDDANKQPFDIHFYIVGLLFLIFDVEIILLFPWSLYLYSYNFFIFIVFFLFLFILALGILFEWKLNILEWPYIYKKSKLE